MLGIKEIQQDPEKYRSRLSLRSPKWAENIDAIISLDEKRRSLTKQSNDLKAQQNQLSKNVPQMKSRGEDLAPAFAEMKEIAAKAKEIDEELRSVEAQQAELLLNTPNAPADIVPPGEDDTFNVEQKRWGTPREFGFEAKPHWEIGDKLGILDPVTAAKVTGTRFHFYKGLGAALERAVISFYLDKHTASGYLEILPPYMVNRASMTGTGQLPKFEEDAFKVTGTDYFLIPTAEVPVTNMHRDEILDGDRLPIKYCAYSACFRAEAGSAGRDTRGLIRQHQFNKVELVKFCKPETSFDELEKLTLDAESVLELLELPYRRVLLCAGDLGFSSAITYDLEVWMPSYGRYLEISSCSNFLDYQARRANIRYREGAGGKPAFVHTLNGSGVAVGRTVAAILENYQNEDGSVTIPTVLRKYMGGRERIG
ncbi:MAG: serine--tRNA ligase [Oscillospiraceae bacterium]|nr:serine--tRNA ligase [Oscillospiraceae bacterium]